MTPEAPPEPAPKPPSKPTEEPVNRPEMKLDQLPEDFFDPDDSDNRCFVCGEPRYRLLHEVRHFAYPFRFQQCACGMIKQTPMPNAKFFEWFFNSETFFSSKQEGVDGIWGYYDFFADEGCRMSTSRYRYRKLRRVFDTGRSLEVIKIGPSTGTFLHVANRHGHHAIGCDVSSRFAGYATEQYGVHIDIGRFEAQDYRDGQFDVVVFLNVVENVPNLDEFLAAVQRTVKVGGHTVFNFVDMQDNWVARMQKERYFIYRPPVCYAFGRDVMARMMDQFGFRVEAQYRDVRYMHLEKVFTLLGWRLPHRLAKALKVHRIPFPIYAYPSKVVVATRVR